MAMTASTPTVVPAALVLADGAVFFGERVGAEGTGVGEICFTTGMVGYQETLTDPSFAGQIITFTFPHIGNVGCNPEDVEARQPFCAGVVLRERPTLPSNFRSQESLDAWLSRHGIPGICGIDTRALTRHIRDHGAKNAMIVSAARWQTEPEACLRQLQEYPSMEGLDLATRVTTKAAYEWHEGLWRLESAARSTSPVARHVVAIDYGAKHNILRSLKERFSKVTVVPATHTAEQILALAPDGIFLSNGPGDPAATGVYAVPVLQALIASGKPIFGICLGHQLLARALGGRTEKLAQGHRGANHPVQRLETGAVEITSQNHGFAVMAGSLPAGVVETHVSLFDGTNEGLMVKGKPIFSVQYHPESSPGPHDSRYLFDRFAAAVAGVALAA